MEMPHAMKNYVATVADDKSNPMAKHFEVHI